MSTTPTPTSISLTKSSRPPRPVKQEKVVSLRILGVDPGLDRTGYGVIQLDGGPAPRLIEAGLIRTQNTEPLSRRLAKVARGLKALITQHQPDLMAVEDLYSYYKTPKPAILMGHVRGVVLGTAALTDIPVFSYLPTRIKQSVVGRGHASKAQVARLVQMRLGLREEQVPADVTDALAVALCHLDRMKTYRGQAPGALTPWAVKRKVAV